MVSRNILACLLIGMMTIKGSYTVQCWACATSDTILTTADECGKVRPTTALTATSVTTVDCPGSCQLTDAGALGLIKVITRSCSATVQKTGCSSSSVFVDTCYCNTDYCNDGPPLRISLWVLTITACFLLLHKMF